MEAMLLRTGSGSIPVRNSIDSPRLAISPRELVKCVSSPKLSVCRRIRRTSSESDIAGAVKASCKIESTKFPARIPEEECCDEDDKESYVLPRIRSLCFMDDQREYIGKWPHGGAPAEEVEFSGGGGDNRRVNGGGGSGGSNADRSNIGAYYREMIKSDPTNSLLLRNYAKYLHEVEGDTVKAEEYYGRAILASPGDGEVLSLYGNLIWETERDGTRAKSYFDQAVNASPDDCTVLGSYAHFMWDVGEEEEDDNGSEAERGGLTEIGAVVVGAL